MAAFDHAKFFLSDSFYTTDDDDVSGYTSNDGGRIKENKRKIKINCTIMI